MPNINSFFDEINKDTETKIQNTHIRNIDYKNLYESEFQYRTFSDDSVKKLANIIYVDGKVLEPLVVRKKGSDSFEILSGHKRCAACKYIVEELKDESFRMIPCQVVDINDTQAEFMVYSTNAYDKKTDYEIMREIEGMKKLLTEKKADFPTHKGQKTIEVIAKLLDISRSSVSDYQRISNNLGKKAMEKFKNNEIDKSSAVALSTLKEDKQEEFIDKGIDTYTKIKEKVSTENTEKGNKELENKENKELENIDNDSSIVKNKLLLDITNIFPTGADYQAFCPFCNKQVVETLNINYCGFCGKQISWEK